MNPSLSDTPAHDGSISVCACELSGINWPDEATTERPFGLAKRARTYEVPFGENRESR